MFKKINQFIVGEEIQGYYLVKSAQIKTTAAGKKYLDATLIDDTADINAKIWDGDDVLLTIFKEGEIVKVTGKVNAWQGQKQLSINKYRPINANDEVDIENFVPSAPINGKILFDTMLEHIDGMKNEQIKKLCRAMVLERREQMTVFPAAKSNHHAIRSGLIYHIYRMLSLADALCGVYPHVNADLLKAGIVLHDYCKMDEMALNQMGLVQDYTMEGNLLGHITMGIQLIAKYGEKLHIDQQITTLLQHMVLSHHFHPEYGSPKKPLFIEAELLHYIDMIDAGVYDFQKATDNTPSEQFSEPVWSLDKRRLYNHGL